MNRAGAIHTNNIEWGSKARKEESRLRGLNNTARREAVAERLDDLSDDLLDDALGEGLAPGVTFNGLDYDNSHDWWNDGDGFDDYDPRDWDSE